MSLSTKGPTKLPRIHVKEHSNVLDRNLFSVHMHVPAIKVPCQRAGQLRNTISKDIILGIPRVKTVIKDEKDPTYRLILLTPGVDHQSSFKNEELVEHHLQLDYEYWSADEILNAILPETIPVPSSFEQIGHIIHLNLLSSHESYKYIIAQVLLEKNPSCKTVVNKIGIINTTFRVFTMEILAGLSDTIVKIHEEGCVFEFDYSKVYWNSRLQVEHRRLVQTFKKGSKICDMFAGVGPFAIPTAKHRGCTVWANDLNPESTHYLQLNATRNKVANQMHVYNMDARDFVTKLVKDGLNFDHFIMNLPASAHEFLDVFARISDEQEILGMIHCYVFVKTNENPIDLINQGLEGKLTTLPLVHFVRNVAPNKDMYCVSFSLLTDTKKLRTD